MPKYAMIPICSKWGRKQEPIIRRVLITYTDTEQDQLGYTHTIIYLNTRLVDKDPYFSKKSATIKYELADDYYCIKKWKTNDSEAKKFLNHKRKYHYVSPLTYDPLRPPVVEFTAEDDERAKILFHARKERRD